jgi:PDZ domain-containing protein
VTRRTATSTTAGVVLVVLTCVALLLPVPYVTLRPGPTRDVLATADGKPIVEIDGHRTFATDGSLSLTTVSVTSADQDVGLLEAFQAWFSPTDAIVPRDSIYPPEQSAEEAEQESAEQMASSQEISAVAALRLLGDRVPEKLMVTAVDADGSAAGSLRQGDRIIGIDGARVTSADQGLAELRAREPGDDVEVAVLRDGQRRVFTLATRPSPDDKATPVIGIEVGVDYRLPFDVRINLGNEIGGPSAGTVFALAIYDKLTEGSLTGGMDVAGTGSILADGTVESIGGIQQKVVGAEDAGASVFLVPAANCEEALGGNVESADIRLVDVATLEDAVDALTSLADDPAAEVDTCG